MPKFVKLRIPDKLASLADIAALELGMNRTEFILRSIRQAVERDDKIDADIVLGYIELRSGELQDAACPECGGEMRRTFIGFLAGQRYPVSFGPVCEHCATTD